MRGRRRIGVGNSTKPSVFEERIGAGMSHNFCKDFTDRLKKVL